MSALQIISPWQATKTVGDVLAAGDDGWWTVRNWRGAGSDRQGRQQNRPTSFKKNGAKGDSGCFRSWFTSTLVGHHIVDDAEVK